ncbi:MAG: hypothetical protein CVU35_01750 [Betaproteobacteria bacterium HGW-Betaproteobacteria-8]|nr:MAG: hypothetical protein CVU35_01750 [Betaproteobacteria bacterium HGW-Betaproteobacteria-8]
MTVQQIHDLLLYSLIINYVILLIWFGVILFAHDWVYRLHTRWFNIPMQTFDIIHYASMAAYKIGILLLNLAPLLALCLAS